MSVPSRAILFKMLLTLVVVGAIIAALQLLNNDAGIAQRRPTWPGPVHNAAGMPVVPMAPDAAEGDVEWADARDEPVNWIDIARVRVSPEGRPQWRIELAAKPPRADGLEAAETVISYGLVFETTGDGRADYVVGINNDARGLGHFRVWVTDLATGATEEQVGPPYGFPVEFRHPDEAGPGDDPLGSRSMLFTFLPGTTPRGLTERSPFYAWSAVTSAGETGAWDYAPDSAWLLMPGGP
jgi:hypothetical protein